VNAYCCILHFDGKVPQQEHLNKIAFSSPHWIPDNKEIFIHRTVGFACTQRFITPECSKARMPYRHRESECIIAADVYLTNRAELCAKLGAVTGISDCELLLESYLKWGDSCVCHLQGTFSFVIWDPKVQRLFLASDPMGARTFYYSYKEGSYFACANYLLPFRTLLSSRSLNHAFFHHAALDSIHPHTFLNGVYQFPAATSGYVTAEGLRQNNYWRLEDAESRSPYKSREECFATFRALFEERTRSYLRTSYPLSSHISGGLDSSSVAAFAAKITAAKNQVVHGFTAIPQTLAGKSYRNGWQYHSLPEIQSLLELYPNINHHVYRSSLTDDIFETLGTIYPYIDRPVRNVSNQDWWLASLAYARERGCRIMLIGELGNRTVSWQGHSFGKKARSFLHSLQLRLHPPRDFSHYLRNHNHVFCACLHLKRF
jgi:asparagine synthase (glutamine-hydrolysing)